MPDGTYRGGAWGGRGGAGDAQYNVCIKGCNQYEYGTPEYESCVQRCEESLQKRQRGGLPKEGPGVITGGGGGAGCGKGKVTSGAYPNGRDWPGCPCSAAYYPNPGEPCQAGYTAMGSGADYRCQCDKYSAEVGEDGGGEGIGEFKWPAELDAFYKALLGRGRALLEEPAGFSQKTQEAMFGRGFEKVRGTEDAAREDLINALSSQGQFGTGVGLQKMGDLAWGTEKNVSDIMRDLYITSEMQRKQDLINFPRAAGDIFGTGMNYNQILEALNAARRGERNQALALILSLLNIFKG